MKVAFLGLGKMGSGMAAKILDAGLDLVVWNRTAGKTRQLAARGAIAAPTVSEAVHEADVVVTSLMDDESILGIVQGDDGMIANMKKGACHICVTTISPGLADQLLEMHREAGTEYVSCPVLGRPDAAADGSLIALVAGSGAGLENAGAVIDTFTSMVLPVGTLPSHAATMKLCLNYAVISSIELMSEIYTCCDKAGLNLEEVEGFFKVIYGFPVLHMYAEKIRKREFGDGGFQMTGGLKDVKLMLDTAANYGANFDIGEIVEEKMIEAIESGYRDLDWSAIHEVTRSRANLDHHEPLS
ncbi:NAD(P)-dependent oxidoreductase [Haliea sp. E17]|uniref:NAD(P)-dependent oxidoreductase n=1 Tax=Haliea sp. E17 TaxID=3401576 RepID=UPI003AAE1A7D